MAIDIPSLFSDIIESPEQRRTRLLTEGTLLGRELTSGLRGLAATQAPLVAAIAQRLPQQREDIRRGVGGMLGLDVRTQSEKVQDILRQGDTSTPEGMTRLARALQDVAPAQAIQLRQAAASQQAEARAAAAQAELTRLKTLNELAEAEQRRQTEAARLEAEATEQTRLESLRAGLTGLARKTLTQYGPSDKLEDYINRINGGQYDSVEGAKLLIQELNPLDDIVNLGGSAAYNNTTGEYLIPPETDSLTGLVKDLNSDKFDLASIGRYEFQVNKILADESLSEDEKREQLKEATNIPLQRNEGEEWKLITWDQETGDRYISIPSSSEKIEKKEQNLREFNSRNKIANAQAQVGLDRIEVIREQFQEAARNDTSVTGSIFDIVQSKVSGTPEYSIRAETLTVAGVLGLTALNQARAGSAVGASGFGALSAPELELLQTSIANLDMGLPEDEFIRNLNYIENTLRRLQASTSIELEYNQYIGLEPKPVYEGDL